MTRRRSVKREVAPTAEARRDLRELQRAFGRSILRDYVRAVTALQNGERPQGDHPLRDQLRGWRAFSVGPQEPPEAPRVVYHLTSHAIVIMAAGEHEQAYERARARRRE